MQGHVSFRWCPASWRPLEGLCVCSGAHLDLDLQPGHTHVELCTRAACILRMCTCPCACAHGCPDCGFPHTFAPVRGMSRVHVDVWARGCSRFLGPEPSAPGHFTGTQGWQKDSLLTGRVELGAEVSP